jgi:ubiquinone/menaquinone biosynthesis C-methylase UbiE
MSYALRLSEEELSRYRFMADNARRAEEAMWRQSGIATGARVADIGCGPGAVLTLLAELVGPTGHVVGVDGDDGALAVARAQLDALGHGQADVVQARADESGLPSESFDVVVMRHVLAHNGGAEQRIVDHLAGLVRPGGAVYLVDGNAPGFGMDPETPEFRHVQERYLAFLQSRGNDPQAGLRLGRWLRTAGLVVEEFRGWVDPTPLPRGLRPPAWAAREAMKAEGFIDDADIARWQAALAVSDALEERPTIFPAFFAAIGRRPVAPPQGGAGPG